MGEHPKTEEFTTQEYFETLIGMLNTPIGTLRTSISVSKRSSTGGQRSLFLQDNNF